MTEAKRPTLSYYKLDPSKELSWIRFALLGLVAYLAIVILLSLSLGAFAMSVGLPIIDVNAQAPRAFQGMGSMNDALPTYSMLIMQVAFLSNRLGTVTYLVLAVMGLSVISWLRKACDWLFHEYLTYRRFLFDEANRSAATSNSQMTQQVASESNAALVNASLVNELSQRIDLLTRMIEMSMGSAARSQQQSAGMPSASNLSADGLHEHKPTMPASTRVTSISSARSALEAAKTAEDPDAVLQARDELLPLLSLDEQIEADDNLGRWFISYFSAELRGGRAALQSEIMHRVIETLKPFTDVGHLESALPMVRVASGLCPECAKPYRGSGGKCPACQSAAKTQMQEAADNDGDLDNGDHLNGSLN